MADFDISLIGKRYPELNPTAFLESGDIIALYRTGQPELNKVTWLGIQNSLSLINTTDFIGASFLNGQFPRWQNGKFTPGAIVLSDIPNLPASIITSGIFSEARIPGLPISRITELQTTLNSKEPSFLKGNVVSSTLSLTNNIGRLYGSANLGIELDVSVFSNQFVPANRVLTFISSNNQLTINGVWGTSVALDLSLNRTIEFAANFTQYIHPSGFTSLPAPDPITGALVFLNGASVISQLNITNEGHVEDIQVRDITKTDIGLGNVDNTSDLAKPISTATQNKINSLDSRFLRRDADDNNELFTLTLNELIVSGGLTLNGLFDEPAPNFGLAVMSTGVVRRTTIITPAQISNLQTQIDGLQTQVNNIVQDKNHVHVQPTLASTWTVNHGLGKECSISVYDSSFNSVRYAIDETVSNLNTTVLVFLSAITGKAIFN